MTDARLIPPGKVLVAVGGPTASGKSALALELARKLRCDIVSADSRQIYSGMPIVTAAPSPQELSAVRHHFIGTLPLQEDYSAARYEADVMELLPRLWQQGKYVVMCGGSMLYMDAVLRGIDALPTITPEVRAGVAAMYAAEGLPGMLSRLQELDPVMAARVDRANPRRVIHAVEICLQAGKPVSSLLTGEPRQRPWHTVVLAIGHSRQELFRRINRRVELMDAAGLEQEARSLLPLRGLNSLNTVGLKEMFAYFDGQMTRAEALARIAKNTRVYAKKQLLWLRRTPGVVMLDPARPLLPQALEHIP